MDRARETGEAGNGLIVVEDNGAENLAVTNVRRHGPLDLNDVRHVDVPRDLGNSTVGGVIG